jgi:hypothetical protein
MKWLSLLGIREGAAREIEHHMVIPIASKNAIKV